MSTVFTPAAKKLSQTFPIWMPPTSRQWEEILHLGERRAYAAGELIIYDQIICNHLYYLQSGRVRCEHMGLNGNHKVCFYVESGCIFAEALVVSKIPSFAKFSAMADSVTYKFSRETLYGKVLLEHPHLAANLMELMAYKIRMYSMHMYSITLSDICAQICRVFYQILTANGGKDECAPGITQREIGDVLGVHRNTVGRALNKLKGEGIIESFTVKRLKVGSIKRLLDRSMSFDVPEL